MPYLPPHTIQLIKGKQTHPCATLSLLAKQHTKQGTKKNRNIANNDSKICFCWPLCCTLLEKSYICSIANNGIIWIVVILPL